MPKILVATLLGCLLAANALDLPSKCDEPFLDDVDIAGGRVEISWVRPFTPSGKPIIGYQVLVQRDGEGFFLRHPDNGTSNPNTGSTQIAYNVTGLNLQQSSYRFRVAAINTDGIGAVSNPSFFTYQFPSPPLRTGPPSIVSKTDERVTISWNPPRHDGGRDLTGYDILQKNSSSGSEFIVTSVDTSQVVYAIRGLDPAHEYFFRVRAKTSVGNSDQSAKFFDPTTDIPVDDFQNVTTNGRVTTAPGKPTVSSLTPHTLQLSWSAPTDAGGLLITHYRIDIKEGSGSYTTKIAQTDSNATTVAITALKANTQYTFRVYAFNSEGISPVSNESDAATTQTRTPDPPNTSCDGLSASCEPGTSAPSFGLVSPISMVLRWSTPGQNGGASITGYRIVMETAFSNSFDIKVNDTGSNATELLIEDLRPAVVYRFRVLAINSAGLSAASSPSPYQQTLERFAVKPTLINFGTLTNTSQALSWTAPASTISGGINPPAITGYTIRVYVRGAADYVDWINHTNSATPSAVVENLTPSKTYRFKVAANYASPSSNFTVQSEDSDPTAERTAHTVPSKPGPVVFVPGSRTTSTVRITWRAPTTNGGVSITGYRIFMDTDRSGTFEVKVATTGSQDTFATITGLANRAYRFRVAALNQFGASDMSDVYATTSREVTAVRDFSEF